MNTLYVMIFYYNDYIHLTTLKHTYLIVGTTKFKHAMFLSMSDICKLAKVVVLRITG